MLEQSGLHMANNSAILQAKQEMENVHFFINNNDDQCSIESLIFYRTKYCQEYKAPRTEANENDLKNDIYQKYSKTTKNKYGTQVMRATQNFRRN